MAAGLGDDLARAVVFDQVAQPLRAKLLEQLAEIFRGSGAPIALVQGRDGTEEALGLPAIEQAGELVCFASVAPRRENQGHAQREQRREQPPAREHQQASLGSSHVGSLSPKAQS